MSELHVIGDRDSIMGFRALGLATHAVPEGEDAEESALVPLLKKIIDEGPKIVFVTERFHLRHGELLLRLRGAELLPLFVSIPSNRGSRGTGIRKMEELMERAIGAKLGTGGPRGPEGEDA